jgi:hypothetical protein
MTRILLPIAVADAVNVPLLFLAFLWASKNSWFEWLFVLGAVFHGLSFLLIYRHVLRNVNLTPRSRDRWTIALFVLPPVFFLLYARKFLVANGSDAVAV